VILLASVAAGAGNALAACEVVGHLYVNDNSAGANTIGAFNRHADETPTPIGSSPFPDLQTAPCWVEISHDGRLLLTVNTASSSI
jgi:hypothetical protein